MKGKLSFMWRATLALVLVLSLGVVMAVPVAADVTSITYTDLTEPGQRIADGSDPTALFKVEIVIGTDASPLDKVRMEFESISGFTQTDLDTVSLYLDDGDQVFEPGAEEDDGAPIAAGEVTWVGLVATVDFTDPEDLGIATHYLWVAIETSATIANGDQFRARLWASSLYIDSEWSGTTSLTTSTITADTEEPVISAVVGSTLGDDKITVTFSEEVVAADDADWSDGDELALIKTGPDTAHLENVAVANATFSYDEATFTLTITLSYADPDWAYLTNGDIVAVTPAENFIEDMSGKAVAAVQVVSGAISGDSRAPRVAPADIVGDSAAAPETITITFSEIVLADDETWSASEVAQVRSGADAASLQALDLTDATYGIDGDELVLTITLDSDHANLVNGNILAFTPAEGAIIDLAGIAMAFEEVVGTTAIGGDSTAPTIPGAWAFTVGGEAYNPDADRHLTDADTLTMTITFSEAMADSPQVSIVDASEVEILAATDMTVGVGVNEWSYGFAVPAGHDGEATITASGTDMAGNALGGTVIDTFTIDNTVPSIPPANITSAAPDAIIIIFSEDTRGDWDEADNTKIIDKDDFASIKTDGTTLSLDNATFSYVEGTFTLTITLDYADDGAYLISGDTVALTPASGALTDEAGNALAATEVVGSLPVDETTYAEVWVDDDFTEATLGWSITHFETIAEGINAVAEGGTVNVLPGTYSGDVLNINKELTLTGVKADGSNAWTVGTAGADATAPTITYGSAAVMIEAHKDNTTIQGFNIDCSHATVSRAIEFGGAPQDNFTIQYCSFNTDHSVRMLGLSPGRLATDFTITYNRFTGNTGDATYAGEMGNWIVIDSGSPATGDTTSAVTASTNTVSYNIVTGWLDAPMHLGSGNIYDITFSNNTLSSAIYFIESVSGGDGGQIGDIVIEENTFSGQALGVVNNVLDADFEGDTFTQDDLTIQHNNFTRTWLVDIGWDNLKTIYFSVTNPTEELDAENNWWSTAIALDIAAMAGNSVDYSPWLDAPYPYGEPTTTDSFAIAYSIDLYTGWNLISLPLIPTVSSIDTVLVGLIADETVEQVRTYDQGIWPSWARTGEPPVNLLTDMEDGQGFWVQMNAAGDLVVIGYELCKPAPDVPPQYDVVAGWNLIGFKFTEVGDIEVYLGDVFEDLQAIYGYDAGTSAYFIPGVTTGHDVGLEAGYGYWIALTEEGTIYPTLGAGGG